SPIALRFERILDILVDLLGDGKRRNLKGHEAIHLMLLVDEMMDSYSSTWQASLAGAFDQFIVCSLMDKKTKNSANPGEFWTQYDAWTRTNSAEAETIRQRHAFFARKMRDFMPNLLKKDGTRAFDEHERAMIYHRDDKRCAVCKGEIPWSDLEIHHVHQHSQGGPTTASNGVAVHRLCHPKGRAADEFAQRQPVLVRA
ncbi:MAG: HNH endonuclease, partial [Burkholderiales bacterium]